MEQILMFKKVEILILFMGRNSEVKCLLFRQKKCRFDTLDGTENLIKK